MKRQAMFCSALMAALLLSGCGTAAQNPSSPAPETDEQTPPAVSASVEPSAPAVSGALTLEDVLAAPASDAADFTWREAEDGSGVYLSGCTSDDDILVVPDEVDGKPVIGLDANGLSFIECRAIVLPDSMRTIADASIGETPNLEMLVYGAGLEEGVSAPTGNLPALNIIYVKDGAKNVPLVMAFGADDLEKIYLPASLDDAAMAQTEVCFDCGTPTFVVEAGSAAEQYAQDNGYPFENP